MGVNPRPKGRGSGSPAIRGRKAGREAESKGWGFSSVGSALAFKLWHSGRLYSGLLCFLSVTEDFNKMLVNFLPSPSAD
jgi:hypothetical protein